MYVCVQIYLPPYLCFAFLLAYVELCGFPHSNQWNNTVQKGCSSLSPSRGPFHPDQTSPPNRCHPHLKQDFSVGHIKHHLGGRQTKKSVSQIMAEIVFEHEMTKS
jgi:hypothetical protein